MHEIYALKDMLMQELEEYGRKGEMSAGTLEIVDKLAHAIKNLCKIIEAAEEEEEYSSAGGSYERGGNSYARGGSGGGGSYRNSYARGRGRNARRDSMGRYSSENRRYSREGGMNRGGYSRADEMEEMVESIRSMMQELPQEVQQDAQRFVQKLEQQMM